MKWRLLQAERITFIIFIRSLLIGKCVKVQYNLNVYKNEQNYLDFPQKTLFGVWYETLGKPYSRVSAPNDVIRSSTVARTCGSGHERKCQL